MNKRAEAQEVESPFVRLAQINVNEHVEKKNGLSYLSWPWAIDQLMRADPQANWEFHQPQMFGETMMVSCTVTAFGKPITMHLPVMDHRNKAIPNPDAFSVNKNMMRCIVKAIACHGLGLYIYAGEDLPDNEAEAFASKASEKKVTPTAGAAEPLSDADKKWLEESAQRTNDAFNAKGVEAALSVYDRFKLSEVLDNQETETEAEIYRWSLLDSKTRTAITKHRNTLPSDLASQA